MEDVKQHSKENMCMALVGTKADLVGQRVVDPLRVQKFAKELGIAYFETSSQSGAGVEAPFLYLAKEVIDKQLLLKVSMRKKRENRVCCGSGYDKEEGSEQFRVCSNINILFFLLLFSFACETQSSMDRVPITLDEHNEHVYAPQPPDSSCCVIV